MSPRVLAHRLLAVVPSVLVTLHFGSPWPAVTLLTAALGASTAIVLLAVAVSVSRLDVVDLHMADRATANAVLRDAGGALWNLPGKTAVAIVWLWLVWVLSAPGYALELLTLAAMLSVLSLGWAAVVGMPPLPTKAD